MEIDSLAESNGSLIGVKENGFHLYPVSECDSGEGLPYAPVDWPNPGDRWRWRTGKRIAMSGFFLDRYLYLPSRLLDSSTRKKGGFASKLSVEQYIRATFPSADVDAFFASFSWKIPSKKWPGTKGNEEDFTFLTVPGRGEEFTFLTVHSKVGEHLGTDSQFGAVGCKAGNKMCSSLVEARNSPSEAMACDICCSEPGFCRDCCCILCSKTISFAYGGYSFIKCKAVVGDSIICGHIAHILCALRAYMAGTVGGNIDLDAEYFCRRCDMRTDLISHVTKLLRTCESIYSRDDVEMILHVGYCVLRDSQRTSAKSLFHRIELALAKLQNGTSIEDIWKTEDLPVVTAGLFNHGNDALVVTNQQEPLDFGTCTPQNLARNFDLQIQSLKLEDEINEVLQDLRRAQESEYKIAVERLCGQKDYILNMYQRLDKDRSELSTCSSSDDPVASLEAVLERVDQIKQGIKKLREMEQVAKGFGKTSKYILKEHFGLETHH